MTSLIRLKQPAGTIINGDYSVNVGNTPILIEDGTEVALKSAYIDTRQAGGNSIEITADNQNISITSGMYMMRQLPLLSNTGVSPPIIGYNAFISNSGQTAPPSTAPDPDGKNYVLSRKANNTAMRYVTAVTLNSSPFIHAPAVFGDTLVQFKFLDPAKTDGSFKTFSCYFPQEVAGNPSVGQVSKADATKVFNIHMLRKSNTSSAKDDFFLDPSDPYGGNAEFAEKFPIIASEEVDAGGHMTPVLNTFSYTLPLGHYSPDALAKAMGDEMAKFSMSSSAPNKFEPNATLVETVSNKPSKSPFFTSTGQLKDDASYGVNTDAERYLVSTDLANPTILSTTEVTSITLGASQITLIYDPEINKFLFQQLHTNITDVGGKSLLRYQNLNNTGTDFFMADKHSGIFFTDLQPASLWQDTMGFGANANVMVGLDPNKTVRSYGIKNAQDAFVVNPNLVNVILSQVSLKEGVNITSNFAGIDSAVQKNDNYFIELPVTNATNVETFDLMSIVAPLEPFFDSVLEHPYFMVEISGFPSSSIRNLDSDNSSIRAIISKYYSTDNFTIQSSAEGSLVYVHRGASFYLNSLHARILDPDETPADSIGANNTLFLEVVKKSN